MFEVDLVLHAPPYGGLRFDGRCYFSIYILDKLIKGLGGVQQTKEALDAFRAKTRYPNIRVSRDNSPPKFQAAPQESYRRALTLPPRQPIVTIYAWKEWTEGGYLEPDTMNGFSYLNAIKTVFAPQLHATPGGKS